MHFRKTWSMEEKLRFVLRFEVGDMTMSELCRQERVCRNSGYEWLARYGQSGPGGLAPLSRAPHSHPNAVPVEVEAAVLAVRAAHPTWGPRKVRAWLGMHRAALRCPAASTIGEIFSRHGLTVRRKRRHRTPARTQPFGACTAANDSWAVDFKGWFRTGDGSRCDPLTISDSYSRYLIRCQAVARADTSHVWPVFDAAFREFGLPKAVRSDNGAPFASCGAGGLSQLSVKLVKAGVVPERIDPGKPQQNGRHERMHQTLKRETACPPAHTLREQQRRFATFRRIYNEERPHEALSQQVPSAHYAPSPRAYSGRLHEPEYAAGQAVRRVRSNGEIKWRSELVFLSSALIGEPVGIEECEDGRWLVSFGPLALGWLHHNHGTLCLVKPRRERAVPLRCAQPEASLRGPARHL